MKPKISEVSAAREAVAPIAFASAVEELLQLYTALDKAAATLPFLVWPTPSKTASKIPPGEMGTGVGLRPLVIGLLHGHFDARLSALRQHILLETHFSDDAAKTVTKINLAKDFWRPGSSVGPILFGGVLPLLGPLAAVWKMAFPGVAFAPSAYFVLSALLFSTGYATTILIGSFRIKRGLMLGGKGRGSARLDLLPGTGAYGREREILGPIGLAGSEFPLDLAVYAGAVWIYMPLLLASMFNITPPLIEFMPFLGGFFLIICLMVGWVSWIAWVRRKKLGRA